MQRIDDKPDEKYWKFAIAGASGTGKTTLGVTAPAPLILLSERQGMPSIKQAAKRLGVPVPPVLLVERAADYRIALRALRGDRSGPFVVTDDTDKNAAPVEVMRLESWPQTVVLDSLSDACTVFMREIREQAPPRPGKDGLPVDAQRFWGVLSDRTFNLMKLFRDLPMNVVFLCLRDERVVEDADGNVTERIVQPKLSPRSLVADLCAAVNVVGYSYRTHDKLERAVYGVVLEAGERAVTKPCEPLRSVEVANLSSWIERLNGALDAPPEPVAPLELQPPIAPAAPAAPAPPVAPRKPRAPRRDAQAAAASDSTPPEAQAAQVGGVS
jgi:hypothetical protein